MVRVRMLVIMILGGFLLVGHGLLAERPGQLDPGGTNSATPTATATVGVAATPGASPAALPLHLVKGCGSVEAYRTALSDAIDNSGAFAEFYNGSDEADAIDDPERATQIVADGEQLEKSLLAMDVPAEYAEGHAGIIAFLKSLRDEVAFYNIDSSHPPSGEERDEALRKIYRGEVSIAKACPEAFSGKNPYIFIDPADLKDQYGN